MSTGRLNTFICCCSRGCLDDPLVAESGIRDGTDDDMAEVERRWRGRGWMALQGREIGELDSSSSPALASSPIQRVKFRIRKLDDTFFSVPEPNRHARQESENIMIGSDRVVG